ncbi:MAG: PspC domain-containing protein [Bacteroides sp.]
MKKTLTVNLGGTVFHIDEDAYRLLDNYLCNLRIHFRKQQGAEEIVNDMETRISELFSEKLKAGLQVITIAEVEEMISRMGKPEDFEGENFEEPGRSSGSATAGTVSGEGGSAHRLFRDPDKKVLGGVASGIAAYFNWDLTWVRIIFILLLFMPYCPMIIGYIIAWIIIPEARTAAEKLNMRGEAVTVENIGRTVTDGFEKVANGVNDYVRSGKPRTFIQKLGDALVQIAGFILKACLVMVAVVFSPVLFVFALLFVALLVVVIALTIGGSAFLFEMLPSVDWTPLASVSPLLTVAGSLAGIALMGIPLLSIVYAVFRQIFNWSPMAAGVKWTLLILWLVALGVFLFNLYALGWQLPLYGIHSA